MVARTSTANEIPAQMVATHVDMHNMRYAEDTINKQVTFRDPVSNSEIDYPDAEGHPTEREPPSNWGSGNSPYAATFDDPNSSYPPYLPPVLEEPLSSFSEGKVLLCFFGVTFDYLKLSIPYLPLVLEEPSSSSSSITFDYLKLSIALCSCRG